MKHNFIDDQNRSHPAQTQSDDSRKPYRSTSVDMTQTKSYQASYPIRKESIHL